jgi:hypothetical protein
MPAQIPLSVNHMKVVDRTDENVGANIWDLATWIGKAGAAMQGRRPETEFCGALLQGIRIRFHQRGDANSILRKALLP